MGVTNAGVSTRGRNEASASCAGQNIHTVPARPVITPARTSHVSRRSVLVRVVSKDTLVPYSSEASPRTIAFLRRGSASLGQCCLAPPPAGRDVLKGR